MALQQDSKIANVDHIEGRNPPTMEPTSGPTDPELEEKGFVGAEPALDDASTKKLIRKIDIRLIPALAFLYALALVDRGNLPNVGSHDTTLLSLLLTSLPRQGLREWILTLASPLEIVTPF